LIKKNKKDGNNDGNNENNSNGTLVVSNGALAKIEQASLDDVINKDDKEAKEDNIDGIQG
jgi:hypothetical protein